ncbi:MAG: Serine hydroxymethyltransferase, cytosolic [Paramarteilia canceri]
MPGSIGVDVAALSSRFDDELSSIESAEIQRQIRSIELIASESHAFKGVLSCLGSPAFDSKYSEGKIGARYYGGNQIVDKLESLCQKRALELFCLSEDKWAVNVQCLSGKSL